MFLPVYSSKAWSPYLVGVAIGILSWFSFWSADHPLGVTTAFEDTAVMLMKESAAADKSLQALSEARESSAKIGWEWMLVVGIFIGSFLSSSLSKDRTNEVVPKLWRQRFGPSQSRRLLVAFFGGTIMMLGARMAQGCTSGHGISGLLQLAVSSIIFVGTFSLVGILTAKLIYKGASADD